ncbi:MAG: sporulation protein YunB [Clostridia bacterium]|nr:sporulation protein YunB [Clostridia bacterium]
MGWRFYKNKSRIIYYMNSRSKKVFLLFIIVIFIFGFWAAYFTVESTITPIVSKHALSRANTYSSKVINNAVSEVIKNDFKYSDICNINKNSKGEIISVTYNSIKINKLKTELTDVIIKDIENLSTAEAGIPIGNITGSILLSGRGPKIPIKLLVAGSPDIKFEDEFISAGINQTKHKISIIIILNIEIILTNKSRVTSVKSEVPVSETLIIGDIPNVYISK